MDNSKIGQAIFNLGQLCGNPPACNTALLQRLVDIAASALGAEFVVAAVFEQGIERHASHVAVAGPWPIEAAQRVAEVTRWEMADRPLAQRLASLDRNTLHRRSEMIDERTFKSSRLFTEVLTPMRLTGDQAVGVFRRTDGVELMISVQSGDERAMMSEEGVRRAQAIAAFVAQCWAGTWRVEPAWMRGLKPQSRRVLDDVLEGYDDDQIAIRTGLTYHSVRAHLKRLFRDADVRSRLHLMQSMRTARTGGVLESPPVANPAAVGTVKPVVTTRRIKLAAG